MSEQENVLDELERESEEVVVDPPNEDAGPFRKTAEGWEAVIDVGDGSGVQVYRGKTKDEVSAKLIEAQINATRKIRQQERVIILGGEGEEFVPEKVGQIVKTFEPEAVDDAEIAGLLDDLRSEDRSKQLFAHRRLTEISFGASLPEVRQTLRRTTELDSNLRARAEGEKFRAAYPEIAGNRANAIAIANYCEKKGWDPTFKNMSQALKDLRKTSILVIDDESEPPNAPAPPTPAAPTPTNVRPRHAAGSTGLRPTATSATRTPPPPSHQRQSDAEFRRMCDLMDTGEFGRRCAQDKDFRERVDKVYAQ